ncbi:MAG TPA: IS1595 family transposase [Flavobacteriales bacterium]|nr:IS1595 family transposase [Flavobacteriales bacterium]
MKHTRQCTRCGYQAAPTSGTLFHQVKLPILKAFYIVYFIATNKQGISSTELSRKLGLRQKAMKAMASSLKYPIMGKVEVDETVVGKQEEGTKGHQNEDKKLVVVAIEREGKGINRMYARVIEDGSHASLKPFFEDHIDPGAKVSTNEWKG